MKRTKSTRVQVKNSNNNNNVACNSSCDDGNRGGPQHQQHQKRLGYSVDELVDRLSRMYSLAPSRAFQRKVAVALKRGVDYGILVKSRNRYRYDPEHSLKISLRKSGVRKRRKPTIRRRSNTNNRNPSRKPSSASTGGGGGGGGSGKRMEKPKVPRPTVPPPPSFRPAPKILTREPFGKVIKHSSYCLHM